MDKEVTGSISAIFYSHIVRLVGDKEGVDNSWAPVWKGMCEYVADGNYARGFLLNGPVGCGKSTTMRALGATLRHVIEAGDEVFDYPPVRMVSAEELNTIFDPKSTELDYKNWLGRYQHVIIDDVGAEEPFDKYNKMYHFTRLVQALYEMATRPTLHLTTNISREMAAQLYGIRVYDRLMELDGAIKFERKSYRNEGSRKN